jgi:cytochrome c biogenesis protein
MESIIFKKNELVINNQTYFFEFNDFRKFNILDIEIGNEKKPTNVGPSFIYKVRNESGQAKEYQTYQYPMMIDNSSYFVSGMRKTPQEDYQYLKLPADANGEINGFMIFRELLHSPEILNNAIKRVVTQSFPEGGEKSQIYFEGVERVLSGFIEGGYSQIAESIDTTLPIEDQKRIANSYIKIIFLVGKELINIYESNNLGADTFLFESNHKFVQEALTGFNDSFFYGLPIFLELKNYVHVQSSGLQLTKSPGQFWVYLGSVLLVLGIFCMIYIQEVRLWILKKKHNKDILLALTTNRHRLEFDQFALKISQLMKKTFN